MFKKVTWQRKYPGGYVLKHGIVDGAKFGGQDFRMTSAFTLDGLYIGDARTARFLCQKKGIAPELSEKNKNVCSIGFCDREQKWYGWSHRAIHGFGVGDVAKEGDLCTMSGYIDEYIEAHPELDRRVPVGFEAKTLEDAKRMAIAFADSVS